MNIEEMKSLILVFVMFYNFLPRLARRRDPGVIRLVLLSIISLFAFPVIVDSDGLKGCSYDSNLTVVAKVFKFRDLL